MLTPAGKTVALVEWNWMGHHPTYFKLFYKALVELGSNVVGFCPNKNETMEWLTSQKCLADDRGTRRDLYTFHRVPEWRKLPRGIRRPVRDWRHFVGLAGKLRQWERKTGKRIDLVFFACVYDHEFRYFINVRPFFRYNWSSLYLYSRQFRKPGSRVPQTGELPCAEKILGGRRLHSVAVLDEGIVESVKKMVNGRPVVVFPDIAETNCRPLSNPHPFYRKLKRFAGDAPLVGILGQLQPTKGVLTLAEVAHNMRFQTWSFAFIGDVLWHMFHEDERRILRELGDSTSNVFAYYQRMSDEPAFNAAIQACDIIFAAYHDFPNSSNMLAKAAVFEKPIIVSDGYLMAERVRRYRMGEVVPEGDVNAVVDALERIGTDIDEWKNRNQPRWEDYQRDHSYERLKKSFRVLLSE